MENQEHGPQAFYAGGPGEPYYQPTILCLCNWSTDRELTWEECGRLFDEHLLEVRGALGEKRPNCRLVV